VEKELWKLWAIVLEDFNQDGSQKMIGGKYFYGKHTRKTLYSSFNNAGKRRHPGLRCTTI
jgi:hypothetical protein